MNTKPIRKMFTRILYSMIVLAMVLSVSTVVYAAANPFVGKWEAIDVDGSDIRLVIAGPPNGPFQVTWTESYISFCNGEAGIVRGTAWLNEMYPNLLEADLYVECFTTGNATEFHLTFRYHPATNTLSSLFNAVVTIWHRPGVGRLKNPQPWACASTMDMTGWRAFTKAGTQLGLLSPMAMET